MTDAWLVWFPVSTTRVDISNVVMWEMLHNNADWDCFKTLTLSGILKTQNRFRKESCASLAVTRLFPWVGCLRNKLQSHSVRRILKLFLLMQVYAWMEFALSISGIRLLKCCILPPTKYRDTKSVRGETCSETNHQANTPTPKSRFKFKPKILSYPM